jgi:hypothetical protein
MIPHRICVDFYFSHVFKLAEDAMVSRYKLSPPQIVSRGLTGSRIRWKTVQNLR